MRTRLKSAVKIIVMSGIVVFCAAPGVQLAWAGQARSYVSNTGTGGGSGSDPDVGDTTDPIPSDTPNPDSSDSPAPAPDASPTALATSSPEPTESSAPVTSPTPAAEEPPAEPMLPPAADASPRPTGDPCKNVAAAEGSEESSPPDDMPGQVKHYCAAGKASEKASKGQKNSAMIHAGVAGICTVSCVSEKVAGMMGGWLCSGAAIAGGVADYALTKEYQGALMSIAGGVGSKLLLGNAVKQHAMTKDQKQGGPPDEASAKNKGNKWAACATAAVEAVNAFMRSGASKKSSQMAKEHFEKAKELNDSIPIPAPVPPPAPELAHAPMAPELVSPPPPTTGTSTLTAGLTSPTLTTVSASFTSTPEPSPLLSPPISFSSVKTTPSSCNSTSFEGVVSCAVATSGGALSEKLESPRFRGAIEQFLASPADELLKMDGPAEVIRRAFDQARLSSDRRQHLDQALGKVGQELDGMTPQGSGKGSFNALANVEQRPAWKQLLASVPGISGLISSPGSGRDAFPEPDQARQISGDESTEGLEEDRTVSLFTRVSRRYRESFDALTRQDYSTEQNRLLSK